MHNVPFEKNGSRCTRNKRSGVPFPPPPFFLFSVYSIPHLPTPTPTNPLLSPPSSSFPFPPLTSTRASVSSPRACLSLSPPPPPTHTFQAAPNPHRASTQPTPGWNSRVELIEAIRGVLGECSAMASRGVRGESGGWEGMGKRVWNLLYGKYEFILLGQAKNSDDSIRVVMTVTHCFHGGKWFSGAFRPFISISLSWLSHTQPRFSRARPCLDPKT